MSVTMALGHGRVGVLAVFIPSSGTEVPRRARTGVPLKATAYVRREVEAQDACS